MTVIPSHSFSPAGCWLLISLLWISWPPLPIILGSVKEQMEVAIRRTHACLDNRPVVTSLYQEYAVPCKQKFKAMNSLSLQATTVFLKLVFRREVFVSPTPKMAVTAGEVTPWIMVAVGLMSLMMSLFVWRFPPAAERGARERHQYMVERDERAHQYMVEKDEQALLFKGFEALSRGEDLNHGLWRPFFDLIIKNEAADRARGHTAMSIFERWPETTRSWHPGVNAGEGPGEQRESGAERGSYQQTPASHRGSPRRRLTRSKSASPVKPPASMLGRLSFESRKSTGWESSVQRAGDSDLPDHF